MEYTALKEGLETIRQGSIFPLWLLIVSLIGSALGAYLTPYLSKKAETRALQEDFAKIREQLKTTTKDTEEIKDLLSNKAWRTQKQWSALEQYYRDLLTNLHKFKLALSELTNYYDEPGSEHMPDSKQGEHFKLLLRMSNVSYKELQQLVGPAALYLSSNSLTALVKLEEQHRDIAKYSDCTADYVNVAYGLASIAYEVILVEAKEQLQLGQSNA